MMLGPCILVLGITHGRHMLAHVGRTHSSYDDHLMIPEDPDREQTSKGDSHCNNSFTIAQLLHA